jgi:uncharacterized Zn-binding protein involved in type VI secretion
MAAIWIAPGFTFNATEGNGAITPIPCNVTINGATPILEGSVVAPHGSHTASPGSPITISGNLGPANILINGLRIATESSTASCGDGIAPGPPDPAPKTLSTTVTI